MNDHLLGILREYHPVTLALLATIFTWLLTAAGAAPVTTAAELGFAPWGNSGPGGNYSAANYIVDGMRAAGYRLPTPAPYDGPGAGTHGDQNQFIAALQFFPGKSRQ